MADEPFLIIQPLGEQGQQAKELRFPGANPGRQLSLLPAGSYQLASIPLRIAWPSARARQFSSGASHGLGVGGWGGGDRLRLCRCLGLTTARAASECYALHLHLGHVRRHVPPLTPRPRTVPAERLRCHRNSTCPYACAHFQRERERKNKEAHAHPRPACFW